MDGKRTRRLLQTHALFPGFLTGRFLLVSMRHTRYELRQSWNDGKKGFYGYWLDSHQAFLLAGTSAGSAARQVERHLDFSYTTTYLQHRYELRKK